MESSPSSRDQPSCDPLAAALLMTNDLGEVSAPYADFPRKVAAMALVMMFKVISILKNERWPRQREVSQSIKRTR
jgi:hypothetical protein